MFVSHQLTYCLLFLISGLTFVSKVNLNIPLIADNGQKESGEIEPTLSDLQLNHGYC
jgi:hypothetical protein